MKKMTKPYGAVSRTKGSMQTPAKNMTRPYHFHNVILGCASQFTGTYVIVCDSYKLRHVRPQKRVYTHSFDVLPRDVDEQHVRAPLRLGPFDQFRNENVIVDAPLHDADERIVGLHRRRFYSGDIRQPRQTLVIIQTRRTH